MDRVSVPSAELEAKTQEWAKNTWVWVLHDNEAVACTVTKKEGDTWTVRLPNGSEVKMNKDECDLQNPPKFDKCEDMANLTHLNELSVLANLKDRYLSNLIYTYSGLFLVVINPWRRLPLYTDEIVAMYKGRKRKEMPPHIFAVCDEAYRAMLENKENQSLLITGESGAGKTENTKKVIQYLASIAGTAGALSSASGESGQGVLEKQIVKTNPLLESFGNAKTVRNNNSSRFGKFIRIEFRGDGKIVGCNIDNYLLEKSRVVRHSQNERSFHIFYQIIAGATDEMKKSYLLENFRHYKYLQGITEIDGVNNAAEFKDTIEAMDIIGFSDQDKSNIWSIISACMLFGNMAFSSGKRDDAASITDPSVADKIAYLLGIPSADFQKGLIKPRIKAGRDWVTAMVTAEKAAASVDALAKSTYERLFKWIVNRINQALETQSDAQSFIGCLDIAGFEIFELNSFEQLCINLTNEKLQMFFNHHMFILEQEEYAKEGIEWKFIDFGFDLIPTIDLIEKPMGIMSILDEECLFPKATDKSFLEKLNATHDKKHPKYSTVRLHPDTFVLKHYAGEVEYDTKDWLEKNKDPINDNVAKSLSRSSNALVAVLFEEFVDMEGEGDAAKPSHAKRQKANTFITVSQRHRQNLNHLMTTLQNTVPHFVRCIIPNEQKKPGLIEAPLVMDQLKCNGVLEGIRICRLGFPSKVPFAEFKQRYEILATDVIPKGFMDGKVACEKLVKALEIPAEQVRIGISKVFFKAGVIAELEERRDAKLGRLITGFQAICRGWFARRQFRREHGQEEAIKTIQKNARIFIELYQWSWWKLYRQVKPLLSIHRQEQQEKGLKDKIKELEKALEEETKKRAELEALKTQIIAERDRLLDDLQAERDTLEETIASLKRTEEARKELQTLSNELEEQLDEADKNASELEKSKRQLQLQVEELKAQLSDDSDKLAAIEETKKMMEGEMEVLKRQFATEKAALVSELDTERTKMDSQIASYKEQLTSLQATLERLKKQNKSVSTEKDDLVASLEESDRAKNKSENALRKLEADYQEVQAELREKSSKLSVLEEQKRTADARLNEYKSRLEESESSRTTIDAIKKNLEVELEDITAQLEDASKGKSSAERRNKTLEDELDELSQKFEDEKKVRQELEATKQGLERELEETKANLTKAVTESDNALMEALKSERAKNKSLEDRLATEGGRRTACEERLHNETNKVKELDRKVREIREILRQ